MKNQNTKEQAYSMGVYYFDKNDYVNAFKFFKIAAEQGHREAQFCLGVMYSNGAGVSRNEYESVKWYKKASDCGHADAMYFLGLAYMMGEGVKPNDCNKFTGIELIRNAARLGSELAQDDLNSKGIMY